MPLEWPGVLKIAGNLATNMKNSILQKTEIWIALLNMQPKMIVAWEMVSDGGQPKAPSRNELREERKKQLEAIGIQWESVLSRNWMQYYEAAKQYRRENGDLLVNVKYITQAGLNLGVWSSGQRYAWQKGK